MSKKLSKKELEKLELQMGISKVQHDRPPVGRPTVFYGKTNKQKRREGKMMTRNYQETLLRKKMDGKPSIFFMSIKNKQIVFYQLYSAII